MTKTVFMKNLKEALEDRDFKGNEVHEILDDYAMMIDEAVAGGETETVFIEKLGSPKSIARAIYKETKPRSSSDNRLIAISPFIAIIIFFYSGFAHNAWHPAWMAFLIIPVIAIAIEVRHPLEKITALSPFIALVGFMILGTYYQLWHPMWALFLIIPAFGFFQSRSAILRLAGLYTLLSMAAFIAYTIIYDPTHFYAFFLLVPIPVFGILSGQLTIMADFSSLQSRVLLIISSLLLLLFTAVYLYLGLTHELWHPTWLIFLLLPLLALLYSQFILKETIEFVAYTPFIAVLIFVIWGHFGNAYHYSWLVFLMIPMTAILFSKEKVVEVESRKTED